MIRYLFIAMVILLTTFVSAQACLQVEASPRDVRHETTLETQTAGAADLGFVHVHDNHHYADHVLDSMSGRRWAVTYVGRYANKSDSIRGQLLSPADRPPIVGAAVLSPANKHSIAARRSSGTI